MKKDELLERAINYYRHGYKVAEIARICNVSRMTIHRWVKDTGARRDDYQRYKDAREKKIREEAEKQRTAEERWKNYYHNMMWESLKDWLPRAECKNWNDIWRIFKTIERWQKTGELSHLLANRVFNYDEAKTQGEVMGVLHSMQSKILAGEI